MRAIDLYAGIGGWSLGLKLAGIEVVGSYEWWQPAIDTHNANHGGQLAPIDIRKLKFEDLPSHIDVVVGSPPCTEFSYANRGGSGDLAEGLKDLVKFFEVVEHLKPKFWAMENVPRVAEMLRLGFKTKGHALYRFRRLGAHVEVFDMSEFGTPQSRRRCIATNLPLEAIRAFRAKAERKTLGDVVRALSAQNEVVDPVWGVRLPGADVTDRQAEQPLNSEELRMNREAKEHHPVYNNMAFPDHMDRPARTVTATCTRVSRESIVIADPASPSSFRRLNIRERASLQGFPITYQFMARTFPEKAKMIGNAIPPTFTYLIASAMVGRIGREWVPFKDAARFLELPEVRSTETPPDKEGRAYPTGRAFRAALPGFRFKSGMRFDLSNQVSNGSVDWAVRFYFGPSKDVRQIELDGSVTRELRKVDEIAAIFSSFQGVLTRAAASLHTTSPESLQKVWTRRGDGMSPYDLTDKLAELAEQFHATLVDEIAEEERSSVGRYVVEVARGDAANNKVAGHAKLERNAMRILAGIVIGDWFNTLPWHDECMAAA